MKKKHSENFAKAMTPIWMLGKDTISQLFFYKAGWSSIIRQLEDTTCAAQSQPAQMTCSSCSPSRCSPHLYILNENTYGILIGVRIELYKMSIIALYQGIHLSALEVQPTLRSICHLRHLGMFLVACYQVSWKNPGCPFLVFFFSFPSL